MTTTATAQATASPVTITISSDANSTGDVKPPVTTLCTDGSVNFENDHYNINVDESGEINVYNKKTEESYTISNKLGMDVDGRREFDFKGTTTFDLDDGTKITIDTIRLNDAQYTRVASTVIILDGVADYAVKIEGVRPDEVDDLTYFETDKEGATPWVVQDANQLTENIEGSGFVAVTEDGEIRIVDQNWIDDTDVVITSIRDIYNDYSRTSFPGTLRISYVAAMYTSTLESNAKMPEQNAKPNKREVRGEREEETVPESSTPRTRRPDGEYEPADKPIQKRFYFVLSPPL
jgi:Domain of Unknown Function (DUF1521)